MGKSVFITGLFCWVAMAAIVAAAIMAQSIDEASAGEDRRRVDVSGTARSEAIPVETAAARDGAAPAEPGALHGHSAEEPPTVEPNVPDKETVTKRAEALEGQIGLPANEAWIWIDKSERLMVVNNGRGYREAFHIALGERPDGDKEVEGDGRTPEGEFYVCRRVTNERFQHFLALSYPSNADARRGRRQRLLRPVEYRVLIERRRRNECPPWDTALGGNIGIHGYGERTEYGLRHALGQDWTEGCVGVNNDEIERIFDETRTGTRVVIVP